MRLLTASSSIEDSEADEDEYSSSLSSSLVKGIRSGDGRGVREGERVAAIGHGRGMGLRVQDK